MRLERALPVWSAELGLVGRADLVESRGHVPCPVEYKHRRRKPDRHAGLQLCAQAMCLEEMLGVRVEMGSIYHVSSHQRREVDLDDALRERVRCVIADIRRVDALE